MKSEPSHGKPITNGDVGSNTVPEHMNDPKYGNWTKYGIVYGISNEIPIMTHGSAHEKRFIGPNMDTEYDEVDLDDKTEETTPGSSKFLDDISPKIPDRKSILCKTHIILKANLAIENAEKLGAQTPNLSVEYSGSGSEGKNKGFYEFRQILMEISIDRQ